MSTHMLSDSIHDEITRLCAEGDALADEESFQEAIGLYRAAWDLLPDPKEEWDAATWILAAIGDAAFLDGDDAAALEAFTAAMHCPDAIGNPFLHLRLGQLRHDAGDHDRAADELMRAWMGGGAEIFEEQGDQYLAFLRTRATLD